MNDIYSFYQLISKYKIEIPIIQRDYAQGRKDSKAEDVRKSMVADMIAAVKGKKKLFFDFVYGRIDQHKFIPFDGQQRLTTLFLFHKYVFEKCISCSVCEYKSNCICKDVLLRFSYATRQSSREFCERLMKENVIPNNTKLLSENVRNMQWFYSDWEKDPTIMGMLTMLDEIHNQFSKLVIKDYKPLAEKLTSGCNCPITFHFVDMGEHKLSDETYVKMNARGKTLTPFENFKASLEQYLEKNKEKNNMTRLKENADGKWLDLFWRVVNEGKEDKEKILPDDAIMSFINRHFINVWRCWYGVNKEGEKQKEYNSFNQRIIAEMPLYPKKDDFVSWDIYQNVLDYCGINKCLTPIFNIWDKLCEQNKDNVNINEDCQAIWNKGNGKEKWNLYVGIINNDNRETYSSRVAFYALLRYFGVESKETKTTLSQWMRIVWNIIENSTIDSPDTYQAALRLIDKLSEKSHDIHDALANHFKDFQLGSQYHAQEQVKEETVKAMKITKNISWERNIIEAEICSFLKGKIWVLFQDGENTELEHFNMRRDLLNSIINNPDEYYLPKILLSYYDKEKPDTIIELKKSEKDWKCLLTDDKTGFFSCFQKIQFDTINADIKYQWIKDISTTQLLNNSRNDAKKVGSYGKSIVLWGTSGCKRFVFANEVWGNVVIGNYRTLLVDGAFELQDKNIVVENTNFVSSFDVNFKYNGRFFQWYGNPNEIELDVYLMEEDWTDYKKRLKPTNNKGTEDDTHFCFRVDANTTPDYFNKMLDALIAQADEDNKSL